MRDPFTSVWFAGFWYGYITWQGWSFFFKDMNIKGYGISAQSCTGIIDKVWSHWLEQTQGAECPSVSYLRVTLVIIDHLLKTIIGCGKHFRNVWSFLCSPGSWLQCSDSEACSLLSGRLCAVLNTGARVCILSCFWAGDRNSKCPIRLWS